MNRNQNIRQHQNQQPARRKGQQLSNNFAPARLAEPPIVFMNIYLLCQSEWQLQETI